MSTPEDTKCAVLARLADLERAGWVVTGYGGDGDGQPYGKQRIYIHLTRKEPPK